MYIRSFMLLLAVTLVGCGGSTKTVSRVAADTNTDLSGRWNDTDARLVAQEMIKDVLEKPWLTRFTESKGKPPVITVGRVRNESMEHIDTEVFTKDLERELINSGMVEFVAGVKESAAIRKERLEQQSNASWETAKALAQEVGADFMLIGNISSIMDQSGSGKEQSVFYTVNLELVNIETNQKVWIGNKKIKKAISRKKYS
jgi:uncharacterized protein (TIGR02722 family)